MGADEDREVLAGVSLTFFCAAIKSLGEQHGDRFMGPGVEKLRQHLMDAERVWKSQEPVPKQPRKRKARGKRA